MPTTPRLVSIGVAPKAKAPVVLVPEAVAEAGRGLVGDRYHARRGSMSRWPGPARELSLVGVAALRHASDVLGVEVTHELSRRNLLVDGLDVEALLKRRFRLGGVVLDGVGRCHPCGHLEALAALPGLKDALKGQGGLRARIVEGGPLRVGDVLVVLD